MPFDANSMRKTFGQKTDSPSSKSLTAYQCDRLISTNRPLESKMSFGADSLRNNLPQTPIKNHVANFRDNPSLDFSSGAENPSSPENADTEATPDVPDKDVKDINDNVTVFRGNHSPSKPTSSPTKSPSKSLISYFPLPSRFSPSHKQLVKKDQSSRPLRKPPTKRKRKDLAPYQSPNSDYDSDYDDYAQTSSPRKPSKQHVPRQPTHEIGLIPSLLTYLNDHPALPHILSWWAQMLLSTVILFSLFYIAYTFWAAIRADVDLKADELSRDILSAIAQCAEDFTSHRCAERGQLGGQFKRLCDDWESCMSQDPRAIGRARISVQTWAGILNGFVEPLSGKIIALGAGAIVIAMAVPHVLFGVIRRKEADIFGHNGKSQSQMGMGAGMQSPQHHPSNPQGFGYDGGFGGAGQGDGVFFTPSHARSYDAMGGEGMGMGRRSPSKEMANNRWPVEGGDGSPVKRIGYH